MRRPLLASAAVSAAAVLLLPAAAPATTLRQTVTRLASATTSVAVTDAAARRPLVRLRDTRRVPLASTTKLLTTAAALQALSTLDTAVLATAAPGPDGVVPGDLVLRGGGDGLLDEAGLGRLADAVQAAGIRGVAGSVVGDGTRFDDLRGGPGTRFAFDPELGGTLGALTYARGRRAPGGPVQPDPAQAAAFRFDDVLEARGIVPAGTPRSGPTPPGAIPLGVVRRPVADLVARTNTDSDDFLAETLLKALGAARGGGGTTAAGAGVATGLVRRLGARRATLADGAGLVTGSRGTARDLVGLLVRLRDRRAFTASLPVAGRTGTLRDRLRRAPARGRCSAKTGTLPDAKVTALAGICRARSGRRLAFAILTTRTSVAKARARQDRIVQAIAGHRGAR